MPPGSLKTAREYKAASVLAEEARADFVLAVALGVSAALGKPQETERLLRQLSPLAESLPRGRVADPAVLRAAGIGVRFVKGSRDGRD